ncbi:MAG TPA: hypothetical protein PLE78_07815 [Flavobacteriales bacterium]|nr:hypothetical protein [Flavobacteriales bacterium]HQV75381.1 hypothetical protein [Flavobacteriales bacterium]
MSTTLRSIVPLLLLAMGSTTCAQEHLLVFGIVKDLDSGGMMQNVRVRLVTDGLEGDSVFTDPLGRYQIGLPLQGAHVIEYNSSLHHPKIVEVSTENDMDALDREQEWGMRIDITLASAFLELPEDLVSMPAGKAAWIPERHAFEWDGPYTERYLFQFRKAVKAAKRD